LPFGVDWVKGARFPSKDSVGEYELQGEDVVGVLVNDGERERAGVERDEEGMGGENQVVRVGQVAGGDEERVEAPAPDGEAVESAPESDEASSGASSRADVVNWSSMAAIAIQGEGLLPENRVKAHEGRVRRGLTGQHGV
jgi:hypothetical protein